MQLRSAKSLLQSQMVSVIRHRHQRHAPLEPRFSRPLVRAQKTEGKVIKETQAVIKARLAGAVSQEVQNGIKAGLVRTQMEGVVSEEVHDSITAGLVRTHMEGAMSEEVQDSITAGLVRTQMEGTVSEEVQDNIKAGLVRTQMEGAVSRGSISPMAHVQLQSPETPVSQLQVLSGLVLQVPAPSPQLTTQLSSAQLTSAYLTSPHPTSLCYQYHCCLYSHTLCVMSALLRV